MKATVDESKKILFDMSQRNECIIQHIYNNFNNEEEEGENE